MRQIMAQAAKVKTTKEEGQSGLKDSLKGQQRSMANDATSSNSMMDKPTTNDQEVQVNNSSLE